MNFENRFRRNSQSVSQSVSQLLSLYIAFGKVQKHYAKLRANLYYYQKLEGSLDKSDKKWRQAIEREPQIEVCLIYLCDWGGALLAIFGHIWPFGVIFGHFRVILAIFGHLGGICVWVVWLRSVLLQRSASIPLYIVFRMVSANKYIVIDRYGICQLALPSIFKLHWG